MGSLRDQESGQEQRIKTYKLPIPNGPTHNSPGIAFRTNLQGENFGRVNPGDSQPGRSKDRRVDEKYVV